MQKRKYYNWVFAGSLSACLIFWIVLAAGILFFVCSCSTHKELHEHEIRTIVADMMAKQQQQDAHVNQQTLNIDSMVSSSVRTAFAEWQQNETEKETTTETITTWVDSLGREMRQEQRTTQRELSRQEQQRQQQQWQEMRTEMQRQITALDSVWSQRMTEMKQHMHNSLAAQKDVVKQTNATEAVSWWQKTWAWLKGIVIGLLLAVVLYFTRPLWSKFIKR